MPQRTLTCARTLMKYQCTHAPPTTGRRHTLPCCQCCTCNLCGLGGWLDFIFAIFMTVW